MHLWPCLAYRSCRHPLPRPQFIHPDQEGPTGCFASRCFSHSKCQIRVWGPLFPFRRLLREKPDHSGHSSCQHLKQPSQCYFVKLYRRLQRQPELLVRAGPKAEHAQEFHSIRRSLPRIQAKVRKDRLSRLFFLDVFLQQSPNQSRRKLESFEKFLVFFAKFLECFVKYLEFF